MGKQKIYASGPANREQVAAIKALERNHGIVRCEVCRRGKRIPLGLQRGLYECRLLNRRLWSKNGFCSYGERKEVECDGEVQTEAL